MNNKTLSIVSLLIVMALFPLCTRAQTGTSSLPFLNIPIDAENAGKGNTYFGNEPTATSGQTFAANLIWLYDRANGDTEPVDMFSIQNRSLNGGSLRNVSFTHADQASGAHSNAFTFYLRTLSGGSVPNAYAKGNDLKDWQGGGGFSTSIDEHGFWSSGFNFNIIGSTVIPTLNKDQGKYVMGHATFLSTSFSISYNGKGEGKRKYVTAGAAISNLGFGSYDDNYQKRFLPTDVGAGLTAVFIHENGDVLSIATDAHYSLAPSAPQNAEEAQRYQNISYGVLNPSGIFTLNAGMEYKIRFSLDNKNSLAVRGGFVVDGKSINNQYTGGTAGLGLQIKNVTLNVAYFENAYTRTGSYVNTLYGRTVVAGLTYSLVH